MRDLDQWLIRPVTENTSRLRIPDEPPPADAAALMRGVRQLRKAAGSPSWHRMFQCSHRLVPAATLRDLAQSDALPTYQQLAAMVAGCGAGTHIQRWFLSALAALLPEEETVESQVQDAQDHGQPEPGVVYSAQPGLSPAPQGLEPGADPGPLWR